VFLPKNLQNALESVLMINKQSGSALFYILIAVTLLAALSYAVTQNSRSRGALVTAEQARLNASEIIEYGNTISNAVSQLRLRGYDVGEISFENNFVSGYENPNCTEDECKVFHVNGGGINFMRPDTKWLDGAYDLAGEYGAYYFHGQSSALGFGLDEDDLIMFLPYVDRGVCVAINDLLGITPVTDAIPIEVDGPFNTNAKFIGTYGTIFDRQVSGSATTGEPEILNGQSAGCTESSGGGSTPAAETYHYYQVLIAR